MKHVSAFVMKLILNFVILYLVQTSIIGNSGKVLTISIAITVLSYLLGDLIILPAMGRTVATLADFGLIFVGIWIIGNFWVSQIYPWMSIALISAAGITVGEWFLHKYLARRARSNSGTRI